MLDATLMQLLSTMLHAGIAAACAVLITMATSRLFAHRPLGPAITYTLPVAAAASGAYLAGGVSPAAVILMSAAVGSMLFSNGAAIFVAPRVEDEAPRIESSTAALSLPLAIVLLLSGFTIYSTVANLVAVFVIAVVILDLSRSESDSRIVPHKGKLSGVSMLLVAIVPAVVLGFSALRIIQIGERTSWLLAPEAYLVALLCPGLLAPLVRFSADRSAAGDPTDAVRVNTTVATLCAGVLLPLLFIADYGLNYWHDDFARMANLPGLSWRLDVSLLLVSGFAMMGLRFGLLRADRRLAVLFVILYAAYILAATGLRLG